MKEILYHVYTARGARVTIVPVGYHEAYLMQLRLMMSDNKALHGSRLKACGFVYI